MFSRFFIDRPIFAAVLSIIITLAGVLSWSVLPVAQYPEITPPTVEVSAVYPGANAQVVADTVAAPIEQQVNGVENMLYMSSQSTNDGNYSLTVTFKNGVDLNMAQVLVQNRVALAQPILPDLVKRRGVAVKKKSPSVLMIVNLFSRDNSKDNLYLSNYATIQLKDQLARLDGVGDITYIGQRDYSMRLWLDPEKMAARSLTASDVISAIQQQNTQVAAGQLGQPPIDSPQAFQITMSTMGRLTDADQFGEMIVKTDSLGRLVRLSDVSKNIELGALAYDQSCTLNGAPSVALSVYQLPGSNALEVAKRVRLRMHELKDRFPEGIDYDIVYDTTPFIDQSIDEVYKTLIDAVILVSIVVLLFLQNWRSAIIPLVAVPVAVIGTFAVMAMMNFSLNNLTMFGLVLAIGIVVDDAIVVVEAVGHHIEQGLQPRMATITAMSEVAGPVIAIGLVLSAVFVPCALIGGISGQFYRQFALTIAVSTIISTFNSLTLSPALAALLLRPHQEQNATPLPRLVFPLAGGWLGYKFLLPWLAASGLAFPTSTGVGLAITCLPCALAGWYIGLPVNALLAWFFRVFNAGFNWTAELYTRCVGGLLRISILVIVAYFGLLGLTYLAFDRVPKGFIPAQDKGYLLVNVQLPDSSSVQRTSQVMSRIEKIAHESAGVKHTVGVAGQSILLNANAPNFGAMYIMLDTFQQRTPQKLTADIIASRLERRLQDEIQEATINVFGAPPLDGLGTAGGFKIIVEDRGDTGPKSLQTVADGIVNEGRKTAALQGMFTSFRANTPWLFLDINRTQTKSMGVSMSELFNVLQVNLGSLYVNDFNRFGRTWQVNVQAHSSFRNQIEDLQQLKIRSQSGKMVPLGTLASVEERSGPVLIMRYNLYPAAAINLSPAAGVSSGQAIDVAEQLAQRGLSRSMHSEWTELALLQLDTGNTAMLVFLLAVVLVFLVLAAQYESWSLPLAVILVVPMCLLCSIVGVLAAHLDVNIFTQVGFVVLVGLACKNAILIVEFAKSRSESGIDLKTATLEACKLRLRPIIMTSLAFILGVVPLIIGEGAGAEMRRTLGTAVFAGMLGVTAFGIFLTPVFFYAVRRLTGGRGEAQHEQRI
ncbi:MAG: efflux RND transporter permease subunit [Planctomycetes bacterium]|nr:efflux RND transporter permease subunit [Planctomycetota bacterium]